MALGESGPARADTYFDVPSWVGQPNSTSQEWDGFTSASAANTPNFGTTLNPNGTATLTNTDPTAFLTGIHIYDFQAPLDISVAVPNYDLGHAWTTTVLLQFHTIGNGFDPDSVSLSAEGGPAMGWTSTRTLYSGSSGSPMGGSEVVQWFEWDLTGNASSYSLSFSGAEPSISLVSARVDTVARPSAVPEPGSLVPTAMGLAVLAGLGWRHHRRFRSPLGVQAAAPAEA
jgi:hypothetical protein